MPGSRLPKRFRFGPLGNGSAIARDAQPENIQNSGVYSEDNFREGTVAWLLNAGNTDGTQMFYQTLGKDKMPVFTNTGHNTVYGFYNDQGVFVYENGPDYHGHFGTANGTEFVCKYCGQTLPGELDTHDYLEFTAVGGSVTIGMKKTGSPDNYSLQYSADKSAWTTVELSATTDGIVTIPLGGKCYFRNGAETVINNISKNQTNHWSFTMTGEGTVKADGNIMSLLDASCEKNTMSDWPQHVFTGLFKGCAKLTVAPKLPATKLGQFCYMYMFEGTGIKDAPELPATTIPDGAYNGMFRNCKSLENVSPLPGTSLSRRAYNEMFAGCENLTSVEIANITSMDSRDDSSNASFYNWLEGTASGGKLMAPIEMMGNALVFLPADWQWATRLSANEDPEHKGNFYTTFCDSRYDYAVVDGFKAYSGIIASGSNGDELRLTAIPGNIIAKGDGVVIHGGSDQVLLTLSNGSSERVEGNVLTGSDTDIMAPANCYIMSYGQNGIGFYKYAEDNILAAHKAYLVYNMPAGAKDLRMVFIEGVVNGIDDSLLSPLMGDDAIYNLNGARMPQLRKGVNIVKQADGKTRKVVVK